MPILLVLKQFLNLEIIKIILIGVLCYLFGYWNGHKSQPSKVEDSGVQQSFRLEWLLNDPNLSKRLEDNTNLSGDPFLDYLMLKGDVE